MLYALLALIALVFATPANAQVHVDIGIHLPVPPPLVVVPGVPSVQYAPAAPANVFFYGSQYWVFANGGWHVSRRHEGPWILVAPQFVPRPVLLVPVRYYHVPPGHWKQWQRQGPPHWEHEWGQGWAEKRAWKGRGPDQGWERAQVRADGPGREGPDRDGPGREGHGKGHGRGK
ncbi:MAG TPA: hypothetical protein VN977_05535 [Candidatus Binatia bacterium]|nr:hypothetical protein [Candidatus Binatia bacterium]